MYDRGVVSLDVVLALTPGNGRYLVVDVVLVLDDPTKFGDVSLASRVPFCDVGRDRDPATFLGLEQPVAVEGELDVEVSDEDILERRPKGTECLTNELPHPVSVGTLDGLTSHYRRPRFTTFWRVEQGLNRELIKYMREDTSAGGLDDPAGGINHYIHSYYEDIEPLYRERIYKFGV